MKHKINTTEVKVRYAETDQMGIVYYANYLVWFEVARTEYLLSEGLDYRKLESEGYFMAVLDAYCKYKAPARYGENLVIETYPCEVKNSSLKFNYKIFRKHDMVLLTEGYTTHVLIGKDLRPRKMPDYLKNLLT